MIYVDLDMENQTTRKGNPVVAENKKLKNLLAEAVMQTEKVLIIQPKNVQDNTVTKAEVKKNVVCFYSCWY